MINNITSPVKLYVGTYAKYNNGSIEGDWLDLSDYADSEEFYAACKELHKDEEDPEFMFQDYEGFPESIYSESGNIDKLYEYLEYLEDNDQGAVDAFIYLFSFEDLCRFEDAYSGSGDSDKEFCSDRFDELYNVPSNLVNFIDYEHVTYAFMREEYCEHNHYYFNRNW